MGAAVLGPSAATAAAAVRSIVPPPVAQEVVPGLVEQRLELPGPQVVHVLRVRPGPLLSVAPALTAGATSAVGTLTGAVRAGLGSGVVAGVNGDYFTFDGGWPSGLLLLGGELVTAPEPTRSSLLFPPDGRLLAARLLLSGRYQALDPAGLVTFPVRIFAALNRPAARGQTVLYTTRWGAATPPANPAGDARAEAVVALDPGSALAPNATLSGTVVATGAGPVQGGTPIAPGQVVVSGAGTEAAAVAGDLLVGRRVVLQPSVVGIAPGTLEGIGGGPLLVQGGVPVAVAGEGFSTAQIDPRTSRSAVGQTADGTILLVTTEGPGQGSTGMTTPELAQFMTSLGAVTAMGLDSGGSAAMAVGDRLVIPRASERAISDALLVRYGGVQLAPLAAGRLSPNGDRLDETVLATVRAPTLGQLALTLDRRGGGQSATLAEGPFGPGAASVTVDPRALGVPDGPYLLTVRLTPSDGSAPTEQSRPLVLDGTLASLRLRAARVPVARGRKPRQQLEARFTLSRPARVTVSVQDAGGRTVRRLLVERSLRLGPNLVVWDRTLRGRPVAGAYTIVVEARTFLGTTGLASDIRLAAPPRPPARSESARAGRGGGAPTPGRPAPSGPRASR
jgi:phosphodiester glycosidase